MTYEIYKRLEAFETPLMSARNTNYARVPHKDLAELESIVKELRGNGLTQSEKSCTSCFLKLLKWLAEELLKYRNSPRGRAKIEKENGKEGTEEDGGSAAGE